MKNVTKAVIVAFFVNEFNQIKNVPSQHSLVQSQQ